MVALTADYTRSKNSLFRSAVVKMFELFTNMELTSQGILIRIITSSHSARTFVAGKPVLLAYEVMKDVYELLHVLLFLYSLRVWQTNRRQTDTQGAICRGLGLNPQLNVQSPRA